MAAGGFTDEELVAPAASADEAIDGILAGTGLDDRADVGPAPEAETKLAAAVEAYLADVWTIDEYFAANADPAAEGAFDEVLGTQCPVLVASFDSL